MTLITRILGFTAFVALPQVLGYASGSHVRRFAEPYYTNLKKPIWAPPRKLIGPVWTLMYLLMGVASYLVWRQKIINNVSVKYQIGLYLVQLFFNVNWCPLFFRVQSPFIALTDMLLTLVIATLTTLSFLPVSPTGALLMTPYLFWLFISGYLNKRVWRLNQGGVQKVKIEEKVEAKSE